MSAAHEKLSTKQLRAIVCLLDGGGNLESVAKRANVGYSTLRRWLAEEPFHEALNEARTQALEAAYNSISGNATRAADALAKIATSPKTSATAKVQAAKAIIEASLKMREKLEIDARLARIERLMKEKAGATWQPRIA